MSATQQTSDEVREALAHALRLDLIGPGPEGEHAEERLPGWERPSMWYLTGFLVPTGTPAAQRSDDEEEDDFDAEIPEKLGLAEETVQHGKRTKRGFFPSSIGLSFLVPPGARAIQITATWGDYRRAKGRDWAGKEIEAWAREPRAETVTVELGSGTPHRTRSVPGSGGLVLHTVERAIPTEGLGGQIRPGTRAVSVFLVNERPVARDSKNADKTYAFQAQLSVECDRPFHPRPDLSRQRAPDWDDQVARLHYADTPAFATGHGVSADWTIQNGECRRVCTAWIGSSQVEATEPRRDVGAELSMSRLGDLPDGEAARKALLPLVEEYRRWISARTHEVAALPKEHRATAEGLLHQAHHAADRMKRGVGVLSNDADVLDAFRMANRAVRRALSRRIDDDDPKWRPFQLAFLLLNLPGMAHVGSPDRRTVDLLFFPTGGGKRRRTWVWLPWRWCSGGFATLRMADAAGRVSASSCATPFAF